MDGIRRRVVAVQLIGNVGDLHGQRLQTFGKRSQIGGRLARRSQRRSGPCKGILCAVIPTQRVERIRYRRGYRLRVLEAKGDLLQLLCLRRSHRGGFDLGDLVTQQVEFTSTSVGVLGKPFQLAAGPPRRSHRGGNASSDLDRISSCERVEEETLRRRSGQSVVSLLPGDLNQQRAYFRQQRGGDDVTVDARL